MSRFNPFRGKDAEGTDALERELRARRVEAPSTFVRSLTRRVEGEPRWVQPRVRYVLVGVFSAAVLAAGASANMLSVATTAATRAVDVVQHLSGEATVKAHRTTHAAVVTAADAQYTPTAPLTPPAAKPKISIVKSPKSQTIASGGTATFNITVTNTGNVTLKDVVVTDPRSSDCSKTIGTLAAGGTDNYTCTRSNVTASFENVATVTGHPASGPAVSASDHANVKAAPFTPPQHPSIAIVKSPAVQTLTTRVHITTASNGTTKTSVSFATAHFKIKVTNTGNVPLTQVKVRDALTASCDRSIGTLAVGASRSYNCSLGKVERNFTNVAVATGKPPKGPNVSATGHANVMVKSVTTSATSKAKPKPKFTG